MARRYVRVVVRPYRVQRYPARATEIVFTLPAQHAVQAAEMLMCYMGYGCSQYWIVSAEETPARSGAPRRRRRSKTGDSGKG